MLIRVNGSDASAAPDAPTGLTVTPGDAELTVSWTAPSGTVTGYDVHYTSNTTVAAGAAVQAGAASVGWKAVSRSGTTASQAISSLTNGTTYRVRVRAKNTGDSAWVHSSGTPSASAATAIWSATLTVKQIVAIFRGCDNTGAGAVKCSAAATLTDDDFTLSSTDWEITGIQSNGSQMTVIFSQDVRAALDSYSFCVGATAFAFSDATHGAGNDAARWATGVPTWTTGDMVALSINTSCAQQAVQAPPTDLAVTPGDAELTVSWTAPSNVDDISGYDLNFTSAAVGDVADDAASSGGDPAVAWVETSQSRDYTATSYTIDSDDATITNGVTYRVRLRTLVPEQRLRVQLGHAQRVRRHGHLVRHADGEGGGCKLRLSQRAVKRRVQFDLGADGRRLHGLGHGLGDNEYHGQ